MFYAISAQIKVFVGIEHSTRTFDYFFHLVLRFLVICVDLLASAYEIKYCVVCFVGFSFCELSDPGFYFVNVYSFSIL